MEADYTLIFDGGSLGNPGQGYGSYVLTRSTDGKKRVKRLKFEETMTSNQAEYRSLIAGLEDLVCTIKRAGRSPGDFSLEVRGDSQLILCQVARKWKTKDLDLMPLRDRVEELLTELGSVGLIWQTRDKSERVLGH
jgi:ribonuclease HI